MTTIENGVDISNGLEASVMRRKMECRDTLKYKGSLYVGTGSQRDDGITYDVKSIAPDLQNDKDNVLVADPTSSVGWTIKECPKATNATNIQNKDEKYVTLATALLEMVYPVGSIYMSVNNTNPSTFLGGTWERWGNGKVPIGVDTSDTDFATVEKMGGEKNHVLTKNEMPQHGHRGTHTKTTTNEYWVPPSGGAIGETPSGTDAFEVQYNQTDRANQVPVGVSGTKKFDITYNEKVTALVGVPLEGGGVAHNNLQPYITCYMWKRTA